MHDDRYLITGGTGFIGVYVARKLRAIGTPVALLDLKPDLELLDLVAGPGARDELTLLQGDVAAAAEVFGAVSASGATVIVHLASPLPPESERDPSASLHAMTHAQVNVLDAARLLGARKIIWASATSVFGHPKHHGGIDRPVPNDAAHHPETLYGICKSANERLARLYWARFGVASVGLRLCQVYGPGKKRGRPFGYRMFEHAVLGIPFEVPNGDDIVNWQYVEEVADLILVAAAADTASGDSFNTSGDVVSTREAVGLLSKLAPQARLTVLPGAASLTQRFDTSALEKATGFTFRVGVAEGFARTIETLQHWKRTTA